MSSQGEHIEGQQLDLQKYGIREDLGHELKKLGRFLGVAAIGGIFGGGIAGIVGTETKVGDITLQSRPTIGTGVSLRVATEAVRFDSHLPGNPGLLVEPIDSSGITSADDVLSLLGDVEVATRSMAEETYKNVALGSLTGILALGVLGGPVLRAMGSHTGRQRLAAGITAGALTMPVAGAALIPSKQLSKREWTPVRTILDGVTLNGTYVSGGAATWAVEELQKNEAYYDDIAKRMTSALEPIHNEDADRGLTPILFTTDWHCRLGMARVEEQVITTLGIKLGINGGDAVTSGVEQETFCIEIYNKRVIDLLDDLVIVPGNHDGPATLKMLEADGATILDGVPLEVNGITFYGDADPRRTQTAQPFALRDPSESVAAFKARIALEAARTQPDVLLVHDGVGIQPTDFSGLKLSGHYHDYRYEQGKWIQGGSAGGTLENTQSYIGPLQNEAMYTVLYQDPDTRKIVGHRIIRISTQKIITVGEYVPLHPDDNSRTRRIAPQLTL